MSFATRITYKLCFYSLLLFTCFSVQAQETEMTLTAAIAEALAKHPSISIGRSRLTQSEADYQTARAGLLPRLSANAYYNRLDPQRMGLSSSTTALYGRESFAGLSAKQLLYDGSTQSKDEAAREFIAVKQAGLDGAGGDLVYQVTQSYYRVLEAAALMQAAKEAFTRTSEFETLTRVLFEAGKTTRLDLLKAGNARIDAETTLTRTRELATTAQVLLTAVMGRENPDFRIAGQLPGAVEPPLLEPAIKAEVLAKNPELRQLRHQIAQAERNLDAASGARHPTISLQGTAGNRARDIGGNANEWTAGIFFDLPLYDGGIIAAGVVKAQALLTEGRAAERNAQLDIESRLRQALSTWRTAQADAISSTERIKTGHEATRTAEGLYRAGKATALDVLSAQADLARAEGDRAQALTAYAIARAAIDRLLGKTILSTGEKQ
ncbi:MAG: TolC family protein [Rhodocyclaceae bacterium]|nr:TolC family protein [Rhodocyclaceae bacterium]